MPFESGYFRSQSLINNDKLSISCKLQERKRHNYIFVCMMVKFCVEVVEVDAGPLPPTFIRLKSFKFVPQTDLKTYRLTKWFIVLHFAAKNSKPRSDN